MIINEFIGKLDGAINSIDEARSCILWLDTNVVERRRVSNFVGDGYYTFPRSKDDKVMDVKLNSLAQSLELINNDVKLIRSLIKGFQ